MPNIHPRQINGPWTEGYTLDLHSTGSIFLGYDEFGHERFETKRTEMGELLYRLKYKSDQTVISTIAGTIADFVRKWKIGIDAIVPTPPTRMRRTQPLFQICDAVGGRVNVPVLKSAIRKTGKTTELKDLHEYFARREALKGSMQVDLRLVEGKRILLIDDLMRSGATMSAAAEELMASRAKAVYALALTQTRRV